MESLRSKMMRVGAPERRAAILALRSLLPNDGYGRPEKPADDEFKGSGPSPHFARMLIEIIEDADNEMRELKGESRE